MNPKLKSFLLISAKNAVNAILTNGALMAAIPGTFHLHNWTGVKHILIAALAVVASREATIWIPKLLAWSQSTSEKEN